METIRFYDGDGKPVEFYIEEHVRLGGKDYLLVSDSEDDEANALILKDISDGESDEASFVAVDDDDELDTLMKLFSEMLDDTKIRM